ncbi:MAG: YdcF family protein [Bacilli bacterium]|nr:YdcF family protein [Bacilli bacterium]
MKKKQIIYLIITILFIITSIIILKHTDLTNNVALSKSIQIIIILALLRISYGCTLYIRRQYSEKKYSYSIIMNLGLLLFIIINILRQINLLINNWHILNINDIYNNTIESFSFFATLTLPCIAVLSIYSIITNIILIKRERFTYKNFLGIFLGLFALIGLFGTQAIYLITDAILKGNKLIIIKKFFDIIINVTLSYFYTLIIATLYCNIKASTHTPSYDKDYIIILGCMINKDGSLTPLLKSRVDKAIEFAKKQKAATGKDVIFMPSGGQGSDEVMSEADAMKNYLIKQGIDKKHILVENKSTNTIENMKFSNKIIIDNTKDAKISFSTTNYHVFRSGVIANNCGIDCEGMGSKTKWYFYTNALIREFIANLVQERKKHIALIILMNISIIILVLIGYYYNLININFIN